MTPSSAEHPCIRCGNDVRDRRYTCSPECAKEHRRTKRMGYRRKWHNKNREKINVAARVRYRQWWAEGGQERTAEERKQARIARGPRHCACGNEFPLHSMRKSCDTCQAESRRIRNRIKEERRNNRNPDFDVDQWLTIVAAYKMRCAYCDRLMVNRNGNDNHKPAHLTMEHLFPKSRGGHLAAANILPVCWGCNGSRGAKPLTAFLGRLDAEIVRFRHRTLIRKLGLSSRAQ